MTRNEEKYRSWRRHFSICSLNLHRWCPGFGLSEKTGDEKTGEKTGDKENRKKKTGDRKTGQENRGQTGRSPNFAG
jgi:hypothetical protein